MIRHWLAAFGIGVASGAALLVAASARGAEGSEGTLGARQLEIVDPQGRLRVVLGDVMAHESNSYGIEIRDAKRTCVSVGVHDDGSQRLEMFDPTTGNRRLVVSMPRGGNLRFSASDKHGQARASLVVTPDGDATLEVEDRSGNPAWKVDGAGVRSVDPEQRIATARRIVDEALREPDAAERTRLVELARELIRDARTATDTAFASGKLSRERMDALQTQAWDLGERLKAAPKDAPPGGAAEPGTGPR